MEDLIYEEIDEVNYSVSPTQREKDLQSFVRCSNSLDRLELFYAFTLIDKYWTATKKKNKEISRCSCGTPTPPECNKKEPIPKSTLDPDYPDNIYICYCRLPPKRKYTSNYTKW